MKEGFNGPQKISALANGGTIQTTDGAASRVTGPVVFRPGSYDRNWPGCPSIPNLRISWLLLVPKLATSIFSIAPQRVSGLVQQALIIFLLSLPVPLSLPC